MRTRASKYRGFTLIEMIVAVSLLVIIILAVARIFSDASKAIGVSQAAMEMFSNVRAFADQLEEDIHSMDRSGFLVIKCSSYTLPAPGVYQRDEISFLAHGQFPHRTGTKLANPFADSTMANAAFIHIGHGIVEDSAKALAAGQGALVVSPNNVPQGNRESDFVLLRNAMLLMQGPAAGAGAITVSNPPVTVAAFDTLSLQNPATGAVAVGAGEAGAPQATLTSSRVDVVNSSPQAVMQRIMDVFTTAGGRTGLGTRYEADSFCYRFKTLTDPYATEVNTTGGVPSLINGYYRMHPILLQGCVSFSIAWSDGVTTRGQVAPGDPQYILNDTSLAWFGPGGSPRYNPGPDTTEPAVAAPENYVGLFSFDNRSKWPKALKFTYRVTDPNDRLVGGRTFTQVIRLPE